MTANVEETPTHEDSGAIRVRAGIFSLVVGAALLAIKFYAYLLTDSTAVLSDALESIVNVVTAIATLAALLFAARPADKNHPYGHGKIEFMTAAFEGGLITFAAVLIVAGALNALWAGTAPRSLDAGIALTLGAGLANAALGWFLVRVGTKHGSLALVADGQHVLADFWTSLGIVVGLGLVRVTGLAWLDPAVAILVSLHLAMTGWQLVREAAGGLLDEEDPSLLQELVDAINANPMTGVIRVHYLRAIRSGAFRHIDAHLVVPEFWSVEEAHELADKWEDLLTTELRGEAEIAVHLDPCRRQFCPACDVEECPIRKEPFIARTAISLKEATRPEPGRPGAV